MNATPHNFAATDTPKTFPLTPIQIGLIYESVLADRPWVNFEQVICHFEGESVDLSQMTRAWQALADRHDILRSSFHWEGLEHPEQRVAVNVDVQIKTVDLTNARGPEQKAYLEAQIAQDREAGFDLTQSRSWRLTWFKLAEDRSALMFSFHHALLDGYSLTQLPAEAFAHYDASLSGTQTTDRPAPVPFHTYVKALEGVDHSASRLFYTDLLQGIEAPNLVDTGDANIKVAGRKKTIDRRLPKSFGAALGKRATQGNTTVASMVLSAWGLVVARTSGQTDAVFGVTRSGRHLVPDASLIHGCLINTVPMRTRTAPDISIDDYLTDTRSQYIAQRPHEHASLADITSWSDVSGAQPLFETSVMFDRSSIHCSMERLGVATRTRRFEILEEGALPLALAVYQDDDMFFRLEYDVDRYDTAAAERLMSYVITILDRFIDLPADTLLCDLQMLPQTEMAEITALASDGQLDTYPDCDPNLAGAFDRQAVLRRQTPAISVMGSPEQVTYGELNRRANQLAHHLADNDVASGDLVALFLPRCTDFIIAMLAVIKSGAAFLPIDPSYPKASVDHMLTDSGATTILTNTANRDTLEEHAAILVDDTSTTEHLPKTAPDIKTPNPDRTAYVIYTSGSTGTPKGVMITHRALAQHIQSIQAAFALDRSDQVLQFASLSFDVSLEEIIPTLLTGAELVLRNEDVIGSMTTFLEAIDEFALTVLNLPTAFWTVLVEHMSSTGARLPQSVRLVVVGGEAISRAVLDKFLSMAPGIRCLNGYGPTEVTITSTLFDTSNLNTVGEGVDVPIGRPLPHVNAFVCAPDGSLAPRGTTGELVLAGPSVSKGYLNRFDLTAKRFQRAPLSVNAKAYRTGDQAAWRVDGTIAYKGRKDRQVKVNGFRIELHEVERAVETCSNVAKALVDIVNKSTPQAQLIAWVLPTAGLANFEIDTLSQELETKLPVHMRPTLVHVDRFPTTPGGKVDIAALPQLITDRKIAAGFNTGNADVETLRRIFAEVLDIGELAHDASFYDHGGHSLLAVRLIGRIEQEFGQRLALSALRANPTPVGVAAALNRDTTIAVRDYIVPIQPQGSQPPIYGVHVLGQNECFFRPLAKRLGPDQPVFGLSVGLLTPESPIGVEETAQAYFEEIQRHRPNGKISLAAVSQGSFIAYELAQLLTKAGRDVAMLALFDAAGPAGRPSLKGAKRFKTHMELLRRTGPEYIGKIAANRISNLRNSFEKSRVRRAKKAGGNGLTTQSVEAFVAANTLAIEEYSATPYPKKLTVFRASASVFDTEEAIRNGLGWKPVAKGGLDLIEVPGGHISMLEAPHVDVLAQRLTDAIAKSDKDETARH